jgi:hypothetical protein
VCVTCIASAKFGVQAGKMMFSTHNEQCAYGNIKTYLYKYKTIQPYEGDQSVDCILLDCKLLEQDRDRLKTEVTRSEKWPVSSDKPCNKNSTNTSEY